MENNNEDFDKIQKTLMAMQSDITAIKSDIPKRPTKEEIAKKGKRNKRIIMAIMIITLILFFVFKSLIPLIFTASNTIANEENYSSYLNAAYLNDSYYSNCTKQTSALTTLTDFMNKFINLDNPTSINFLIFLGVIYLIQITFNLALDIIEVILLIFIVIKKSCKGIISLFKKKEDKIK